jgi:hypothetical protein
MQLGPACKDFTRALQPVRGFIILLGEVMELTRAGRRWGSRKSGPEKRVDSNLDEGGYLGGAVALRTGAFGGGGVAEEASPGGFAEIGAAERGSVSVVHIHIEEPAEGVLFLDPAAELLETAGACTDDEEGFPPARSVDDAPADDLHVSGGEKVLQFPFPGFMDEIVAIAGFFRTRNIQGKNHRRPGMLLLEPGPEPDPGFSSLEDGVDSGHALSFDQSFT